MIYKLTFTLLLLGCLAACGSGNGKKTTLTDTTAPILTLSATQTSLASGGTLNLSVTATENAAPILVCNNNGTVTGDVTAGFVMTAPVVDQDTDVTCTATASDVAKNEGSTSLLIKVIAPPTVTLESIFTKKIDVYGVTILAMPNVADNKIRHAASVMAEYLDNDEDGEVDNASMVDVMRAQKATLLIVPEADDLTEEIFALLPDGVSAQDLYASEIVINGKARGQFDATLEEVLHLITHAGFANWNESIFAESTGSLLANAMDIARGGQFTTIPDAYPETAWYSYSDETCDYACMVTEYFYWSLTSILGAQDYVGRADVIADEWQYNTRAKVVAGDTMVFSLLSDANYALPTRLPDGFYTGRALTLSGGDNKPSGSALFSSAAAALPGYKIAYGDEQKIWMMNPDGSSKQELADGETNTAYVSWGPFAQYVYFASAKGPEGVAWEAFRVNVVTKKLEQLSLFAEDVRSLGVSPDGKYLAISIMNGNSNLVEDLTQFHTDLFIIEMSKAEAIWNADKMLTKADLTVLVSSPASEQFWYEELHWNPVPPLSDDLAILAYTKTWRYDEDDVSYTHAYTIRPDASKNTLVREDSNLPVWDFSGTKLVFANQDYFDFTAKLTKKILITDVSLEVAGPAISPDNQFVVFEIGDEDRKGGLALNSEEGENPGQVYSGANIYEPKWSPRAIPQSN